MKQGVLVYDQKTDRMDVRFNLEEYYGGLHCGTCMEVFVTTAGSLHGLNMPAETLAGIWLAFRLHRLSD